MGFGAALDTAEEAAGDVRRAEELEAAVEAVDEGQRLLLELDRRLNATREGFRALQKQAATAAPSVPPPAALKGRTAALPAQFYAEPPAVKSERPSNSGDAARASVPSKPLVRRGGAQTQWLFSSAGFFVKTTVRAATTKLELEQRELKDAITEARDELKAAVCDVARLEGPDSAIARLNKGFDLKPVNKD